MNDPLTIVLIAITVILSVAVIVLFAKFGKYIFKHEPVPDEKLKTEEAMAKARIEELNKQYDVKSKDLEQRYKQMEEIAQKRFNTLQEQNNQDYVKKCTEQQVALAKMQAESDEKVQKIQQELRYYENLQSSVVTNYLEAEKKAKEQDFHRVILNDDEQSDIDVLRPVAEKLSKPIILYKLIYEIYYKPKLDVMFKQVLGTSESNGGIYKITNINDGRVYIGRATKFLDRWRQHAKCGTGADKGAQINARLYEAMKKEGIENFTFEVLDECSTEEQPAREKYWVDYYRSMEYGYNIKSGG